MLTYLKGRKGIEPQPEVRPVATGDSCSVGTCREGFVLVFPRLYIPCDSSQGVCVCVQKRNYETSEVEDYQVNTLLLLYMEKLVSINFRNKTVFVF